MDTSPASWGTLLILDMPAFHAGGSGKGSQEAKAKERHLPETQIATGQRSRYLPTACFTIWTTGSAVPVDASCKNALVQLAKALTFNFIWVYTPVSKCGGHKSSIFGEATLRGAHNYGNQKAVAMLPWHILIPGRPLFTFPGWTKGVCMPCSVSEAKEAQTVILRHTSSRALTKCSLLLKAWTACQVQIN